jgi:DNA uptake protein ComE-like DNA-binding protein
MIRHFLLVGPDGHWKDNLWLEGSVYAAEDSNKRQKTPKIVLTSPLPINTCSEDSLTLLPGVGKVLAGRIEEIRISGVIFRSPDDLKIVKGIGPAMSSRLAPHVFFGITAPDSLDTGSVIQK